MFKRDGAKGSSSEEEVGREMSGRKRMSRQTAANWMICQDSDMSEASQIKRLWHHQTKMSGIQTCQRQRLLRDQAVDGRASQAVSGCSYRALPCLYKFFLLSKLPSPGLPGLYLHSQCFVVFCKNMFYYFMFCFFICCISCRQGPSAL